MRDSSGVDQVVDAGMWCRVLPALILTGSMTAAGSGRDVVQAVTSTAGISSCGGWSGQPTVCVAGRNPAFGCEESRKARNVALPPASFMTAVTQALDNGECWGTGPWYPPAPGTLFGGWWTTMACPAGEVLSGTTCLGCPTPTFRPDLPYALDASRTTCSRADPCLVTNCGDGNLCTTDACDTDAGGCTHAAVSCDDGKSCTADSCNPDAGCAHDVDAGACTCSAGAPLPVQASASKDIVLGGVPCPGLDGTLGATLKLSAAGSYQQESCANDCTSSGELSGSVGVEATLCAGNALTIAAKGKYALTKKFNPECNPATCGSGCGVGYCRTDDGSGSLTVSQSRFLGKNWEKPFPGGRIYLKCGGTLSATGDVGGGLKHVASVGANPGTCAGCLASNMSLSAEASVGLACTAGYVWGAEAPTVGCKKCLSASVKMKGTVSSQSGTCGSQSCTDVLSTVTAAGELPTMKVGFKWWKITAACGLSMTGCGEANSCGACTCGKGSCSELATNLSCSVCSDSPILSACVRTPK